MLNLAKLIKPWKDSDSLNAHINLYGFWSENTFLTKSGDIGLVMSVPGVDYESLDNAEQQYAVTLVRNVKRAPYASRMARSSTAAVATRMAARTRSASG